MSTNTTAVPAVTNQMGLTTAALHAKLSEMEKKLKNLEKFAKLRDFYKGLIISFQGYLNPVFQFLSEKLEKDLIGGVYPGVFLAGSAVPFIHGDVDNLPRDLDIFLTLSGSDCGMKACVKTFTNPVMLKVFLTLFQNIGKEIFKGVTLIGLKDITVNSESNSRERYLSGNLHWELRLEFNIGEETKQITLSIMATIPRKDGQFAFDFRHANDIWSPTIGRMPVTVMAEAVMMPIAHTALRENNENSMIPVYLSHKVLKAWPGKYPESPTSGVIPVSLNEKAEFMIPQLFSESEYSRFMKNFIPIVYFLLRLKITDKGYTVQGGIPVLRASEETHISGEKKGTFQIEICTSGHSMTLYELIKHINVGYKNGRATSCPTCRQRMFFPKIQNGPNIDDVIKEVYPGFDTPLSNIQTISFGESSPPLTDGMFGNVFEALREVECNEKPSPMRVPYGTDGFDS